VTARLKRWRDDLKQERTTGIMWRPNQGGRSVPYGPSIDHELFNMCVGRIKAGLQNDTDTLHDMLVVLLDREDMLELLQVNGGEHTFGASWARRFYNRWDLRSRIATTNMQELPADYWNKLRVYCDNLALALHVHDVPDCLVFGMDETSCDMVPRATRTFTFKGSRKVRLVI
jgi:hypothetical protein